MSSTFGSGRDDADLAAEYALGVLDGASRRKVERRAESDSEFARRIEDWNTRLGPMVHGIEDTEPPVHLWTQIARRLDRMTRQPARQPEKITRRPVSAIWQWLAVGGMGAAIASLAALFVLGPIDVDRFLGEGSGQQDALTATLASENGQPLVTAVIDHGAATVTLIPVATAPRSNEVPELWLLPAGGGAPQSLGVFDDSHPLRLDLKAKDQVSAGGALAISLEPAGGSPTGQPTGPVVASGQLNPT